MRVVLQVLRVTAGKEVVDSQEGVKGQFPVTWDRDATSDGTVLCKRNWVFQHK